MNKEEIEFLENSLDGLYDALGDATDEKTKAEIKTAIGVINDKIEDLYDAAPKASATSRGNFDAGNARREGKTATREMLKRVQKAGGQAALDFALNLPDTMTPEEIERTAMGAVSRGAFQLQSRGTIAALPAPRLPSKEAEANWLREAREHAESQWSRAMGKTTPVRQLSAEEHALAESFNSIAAKAAGLTHTEDGQKRFRGDQVDADLYAKGAESARKIWPGR
jgi:hypothetical protein